MRKRYLGNFKAKVAVAAIKNEALASSKPEIFNTDQGSQYTSRDFLKPLKDHGITVGINDLIVCRSLLP